MSEPYTNSLALLRLKQRFLQMFSILYGSIEIRSLQKGIVIIQREHDGFSALAPIDHNFLTVFLNERKEVRQLTPQIGVGNGCHK